jgi:hypothetical protein
VFLRPSQGRKQKHQSEKDGCRGAMHSREEGFSLDEQHLALLLTGLCFFDFPAIRTYDSSL